MACQWKRMLHKTAKNYNVHVLSLAKQFASLVDRIKFNVAYQWMGVKACEKFSSETTKKSHGS